MTANSAAASSTLEIELSDVKETNGEDESNYAHDENDPNDPLYLKFCFVCKEEAPPDKEHFKNYGGIVCLSCRAFFRRVHQSCKARDLKCKFGGNCIVTKPTRRRCQKCRHSLCLKAGMNPDAVMTEEQKQIRFRKLISKNKEAFHQTNEKGPYESSDDEVNLVPAKEELKIKREIKIERHFLCKELALRDVKLVTKKQRSLENDDKKSNFIFPQKFKKRVDQISRSYQEAISQIKSDLSFNKVCVYVCIRAVFTGSLIFLQILGRRVLEVEVPPTFSHLVVKLFSVNFCGNTTYRSVHRAKLHYIGEVTEKFLE
jgi:hypothetical protein